MVRRIPVLAVIQARMGSSRLPGKVIADLAGSPVLARVVERTRAVAGVDAFVVATSTQAGDDAIERLCRAEGWDCFRGSEGDVLDRFYHAASSRHAANVLRVTSDCPLLCVEQTGRVVAHHLATGADYTHNLAVWGGGMPVGSGGEILSFAALEASWRDGREPHHREHVDEYVHEHPERFRLERLTAPPGLYRPELRLTLDTYEDLALLRCIYERLSTPTQLIDVREVVRLLDAEPSLVALNAHVRQRTAWDRP